MLVFDSSCVSVVSSVLLTFGCVSAVYIVKRGGVVVYSCHGHPESVVNKCAEAFVLIVVLCHRMVESQRWKGSGRSCASPILPFVLVLQGAKAFFLASLADVSLTVPGAVSPPLRSAGHCSPSPHFVRMSFSFVYFKCALVVFVAFSRVLFIVCVKR